MIQPSKKPSFSFRAHGHSNVVATHPTTLEIVTEEHLTSRGDCIVGVRASCGAAGLPSSLRQILSKDNGRAILKIRANEQCFEVVGRGSSGLTFQNAREIVVRKSAFTSDRTLMVSADRAAKDIPRRMVRLLRNPEQLLEIEIRAI